MSKSAGDIVFDLEHPIFEARSLAHVLSMMSTSDELRGNATTELQVIQTGTVRIVPEPLNPCRVASDQQPEGGTHGGGEEDGARAKTGPETGGRRAGLRSSVRIEEDKTVRHSRQESR
jgi:hypothetical protein